MEWRELEDVPCDYCGDRQEAFSFERSVGLVVRECAKCGLAYVSPRPTWESMFVHYSDTYAADDLETLWEDYRSFGFTRPDIARLRRFVNLNGATVLDVGCGSGVFLDALRRAGASVLVGIEPSAKKAQLAAKMVELARIYAGSYEDVELPGGSFDVVTALDLIEHLYRPGEFFRFVAHMLKPSGVVYIKTPNWNAAKHYGIKWVGLHQDAEHVYYFERRSLENYLIRVGILVEEVDYEPLTAGLGGTRCVSTTRPSDDILGIICWMRTGLRSLPVLNRMGYQMLYLLRRVRNRKDIASETAIELIAVGRKCVTSDVPANVMVAGVPAIVKKDLPVDLTDRARS